MPLTFSCIYYNITWNCITTNYTHIIITLNSNMNQELIRISAQFHLKENWGPIVRWMINLIIHTNDPYEAFELIPDMFRFMPCDECKRHAIHNWEKLVDRIRNPKSPAWTNATQTDNGPHITTELLINEIINIQNEIILRKHLENWTKPDRRDHNTRHGLRDMEWYISFRS